MKYVVAVAVGLMLATLLSLSAMPVSHAGIEAKSWAEAIKGIRRCHPHGAHNILHCACRMCDVGCTCGCEEFPCTGLCGRGQSPHCQCMLCVEFALSEVHE